MPLFSRSLLYICLLLFCLTFGSSSQLYAQQAKNKNYNIVFIGNSITYGGGLKDRFTQAPPVHAVAYLKKQRTIGTIQFSNQGVSGYTTLNFLPATKGFQNVLTAANSFYAQKDATLVFSLILGTNDSAIEGTTGAPVTAAAYKANLKNIIDKLLQTYPGCKIIVHHPLWYSPNTQNSARYLQEGLTRLQSYFPQIDALVNEYANTHHKKVYLGDTKGFNYFRKHHVVYFQHEEGKQGIFFLHPNEKGSAILGKLWGKAIYKALR